MKIKLLCNICDKEIKENPSPYSVDVVNAENKDDSMELHFCSDECWGEWKGQNNSCWEVGDKD